MTAGMVRAGADAYTALQRALQILNLEVTKQAAVLAYNHVLLLVALLFVVSVPLVLLLRGHRDVKVEIVAD